MFTTILLFCCSVTGAQDDRSKEVQMWLEKLRSDRIEERQQADQEIRKLGKGAIPELERAAGDKDVDLSERARALIRLIRLKEVFGFEVKDLNGISAATIVEWMEKKTGRKFLYTEELGLRNAKVRIHEELIETGDPYLVGTDLLRVANLGVAPRDSAPGVFEIFAAPIGSKKSIKVYTSVGELPRANEFCTLVLHPRYASPRSVQAALINAVSYPQNCICIDDSGTLLVSDYTSVLRKCAEILNVLDVARSFRISVALLEGRRGNEEVLPEPFRNLKLTEGTGFNQFALLGNASMKLQRVVQDQPGAAPQPGKNVLRFPGSPAYLVEFDGSVRTAGGPTFDRFTVLSDQERPIRLFESKFSLKDENWMLVGSVNTGEGASLLILARAVAD
ncbi:MAG TPA: hypothetical protein VG457_05685 [Planctomycetota bacterium]|nr:hypothetical protein [Planctomycetota bacterium]